LIDLEPEMTKIHAMSTTKEVRLNLRLKDSFRAEMEVLADYLGLTLSSYAHSLLVRSIREEKQRYPEAFSEDTDSISGRIVGSESQHPLQMRRTPTSKKKTG
jgi:hypothetical protein